MGGTDGIGIRMIQNVYALMCLRLSFDLTETVKKTERRSEVSSISVCGRFVVDDRRKCMNYPKRYDNATVEENVSLSVQLNENSDF